ncbi:MAG: hypothetical protein U0169_23855 [Polyangiaceae bacterium]
MGPSRLRNVAVVGASLLAFLSGCGGHVARTATMRTALDENRPKEAIASLDTEMGAAKSEDLPPNLDGDNALFVLDRATIQQSIAEHKWSQRDYEAADKAIDMLDLSATAVDDIGKYMFSDDAGRYRAPPYEKLLVNTLNMVNYLETGNLEGARVEARRLAVMKSYYDTRVKADPSSILGLGGFLAGFTFERSGDANEALRWYESALQFRGFGVLRGSVGLLMPSGTYTSPRLVEAAKNAPDLKPLAESEEGEIVVVVGYGRVPHKIANRVPIGLALTYASGFIRPDDYAAANRLAAQGLVTWVNFPTLGEEQGGFATPVCKVDDFTVPLEEAVNVTEEVRAEWKRVEGPIIASAITRMITRYAAGAAANAVGNATSKDEGGLLGVLFSVVVQGTLTALDTPDTRSWETVPARVAVSRMRVKPGEHVVSLDARGIGKRQKVTVAKGGWALVSHFALR